MKKLEGTSMNIIQDNIAKLKELFPEIFTEGKIDFEVLKQLLGEKIETDKERYSFTWKGKTEARQIAQEVSNGTLRPEHSVLNTTHTHTHTHTGNLYIEGDNLEVLKLLQKSYHGKIKMIYIDPPYNTGKDFVYKDNFRDNLKNYLEVTGQIGEEGQKLSTNSDSSGRYHSAWLNMMYPRLKLARNLLTDDGVIFISIDDNEQENLKKICDEIFGENNFISNICHKNRASISNDKIISENHNHILFYTKNFDLLFAQQKNIGEDPILEGFNLEDEKGKYKLTPVDGPGGAKKGNPYYEFLGINGYWRYSKATMEEKHKQGLIVRTANGLQQKYYLSQAKNSRRTVTTWWEEEFLTSSATKQLSKLMERKLFDNPKNINLLLRMLKMITKFDKKSIILDFFSGSATTAHAVMQLNAEDGGNRKYIMVQLPEICDEKSEAYKAGYKNICEIGKERIRRAGAEIKADESFPLENREKLDIDFKIFKLDSSNIKEWDSETENLKQSLLDSIDNIKSDRTPLDVLYEIILKYGLELTVSIEEKENFYSISGGILLINLDKEISIEVIDSICEEYRNLLEINEEFKTTVILRDSAFKNDVEKTNAMKKLEQAGIKEVRSI